MSRGRQAAAAAGARAPCFTTRCRRATRHSPSGVSAFTGGLSSVSSATPSRTSVRQVMVCTLLRPSKGRVARGLVGGMLSRPEEPRNCRPGCKPQHEAVDAERAAGGTGASSADHMRGGARAPACLVPHCLPPAHARANSACFARARFSAIPSFESHMPARNSCRCRRLRARSSRQLAARSAVLAWPAPALASWHLLPRWQAPPKAASLNGPIGRVPRRPNVPRAALPAPLARPDLPTPGWGAIAA